jgi:heterodisulfide reductase subunit A-like polyferredoxin
MDYERLLCATGPYEGEILRASDKQHPRNIAWIQCVGSGGSPGDNSYCSATCCTYTQKQVILTKDHDAEAECTIFHNDIRSYGKGFRSLFPTGSQSSGVRFIRSYASIVGADPETDNVIVRYATADDGVKEESFDMVVLSVGLNPPADYRGLPRPSASDQCPRISAKPILPTPWRPAGRGSLSAAPSRVPWISPNRCLRPAQPVPNAASCSTTAGAS